MKLLVDGVAFQPGYCAAGGPSDALVRFWSAVIGALAGFADLDVLLLDRGGVPPVEGVQAIPFPSHGERYAAADSELLQKVADHFGAEAFLSTGWTTPLSVPSLLLIPSGTGERQCREAELARVFARRLITADAPAYLDGDATLASEVRDDLLAMVGRHRAGAYKELFARWSRLRLLQVAVEV